MQASSDMPFSEVKTTFNTRLEEVSTRMTNLEERLSPLDVLPLLATRLAAGEDSISQVQSEQGNFRRQFDKICTTNSAAALNVSVVRQIAKLAHYIHHLNAAQRSLFNELGITGLSITDTTCSKVTEYAALKLLDDGLLERDILHVRKMRQKPYLEPLNPTLCDIHAEEPSPMAL